MDNQGAGNNYGGLNGPDRYGGYGNGQEAPYGPNSPMPQQPGNNWFKPSWQPMSGPGQQGQQGQQWQQWPGQNQGQAQTPGQGMGMPGGQMPMQPGMPPVPPMSQMPPMQQMQPMQGQPVWPARLGGPQPQRPQRSQHSRRRNGRGGRNNRKLAGVLVVLLLLLGFGFLVKVMIGGGGGSDAGGSAQKAYDSAVSQADQLSNNGNYDQEAQALAEYLQTNPEQDKADEASLRLAAAYTNAKQYDKAFETYKTINASASPQYHRAGLRGMGAISGLKNDKTSAAQYYSQLIQEYQAVGNSARQLSAVREELAYIQGQQ